MRKLQIAILSLLLLIPLLVTSCSSQQAAVVNADIAKLQADIAGDKAALAVKLQAGIDYAKLVGDVEWTNCQQGILDLLNQPQAAIPDITNPFINIEVLHQAASGVRSGLDNPFVQKLNLACAPWYMREKADILALAAKIGVLIK
jgi:hypothetical protein